MPLKPVVVRFPQSLVEDERVETLAVVVASVPGGWAGWSDPENSRSDVGGVELAHVMAIMVASEYAGARRTNQPQMAVPRQSKESALAVAVD